MRPFVFLVLIVSLSCPTTAEARLFWQTIGSVVSVGGPGADGSCAKECTWNGNQDYFIPRYPSSCRYGLFSPCKVDRTTSPACVNSHPFYPGYCNIYTPCRYRWRNHVYRAHCGCTPLGPYRGPWRHGRGGDCLGTGGTACGPGGMPPMPSCLAIEPVGELPNVEAPQFLTLGSIPVEDNQLVSGLDYLPTGDLEKQRMLLGPQATDPASLLQSLGLPQSGFPTQPLSNP